MSYFAATGEGTPIVTKLSLEDASAALLHLEKHKHAAATAHFRMKRAERYMHEHGDDPHKAEAFKAEMDQHAADKAAALKAHSEAGISDRDIDRAAQAVLDARGETHTDQAFVGGPAHKPSAGAHP